jgi:hypothetical protein
MDHAKKVGWAKDSQEFRYCYSSGGNGGTYCEFVTAAGHRQILSDFDIGGDFNDRKARAMSARLRARRYTAGVGRWRFADITLRWETEDILSKTVPRLQVSAQVEGARERTLIVSLSGDTDDDEVHPDAVALSPDCRYLAVLMHSGAPAAD